MQSYDILYHNIYIYIYIYMYTHTYTYIYICRFLLNLPLGLVIHQQKQGDGFGRRTFVKAPVKQS